MITRTQVKHKLFFLSHKGVVKMSSFSIFMVKKKSIKVENWQICHQNVCVCVFFSGLAAFVHLGLLFNHCNIPNTNMFQDFQQSVLSNSTCCR